MNNEKVTQAACRLVRLVRLGRERLEDDRPTRAPNDMAREIYFNLTLEELAALLERLAMSVDSHLFEKEFGVADQ